MEHVPTDVEVLARSLTEPEAFVPIFDRHFRAVHRYVHRRAGRDLADELAAETFALAFERRASCRSTDSALPWLYGIATNLLRRHRRTELRQLRALSRTDVEPVGREDSAALYDARLSGALAAMRQHERDALLLYALADLTYDEIATALEVPVGTVRTWLHRARSKAQRELSRAVFLPTPGADLRA